MISCECCSVVCYLTLFPPGRRRRIHNNNDNNDNKNNNNHHHNNNNNHNNDNDNSSSSLHRNRVGPKTSVRIRRAQVRAPNYPA